VARAERKRKPDAVRRRTTRVERRRIDAGTPEFQARRALLVGADGARDPRAGDPLGILRLSGHITQAQMDAGWIYAVMRWRAFGKPTPYTHVYASYTSGLTGMTGGDATLYPDTDRRARDIFARGDNALRNAGRLAWSETRRASVEHRLAAWFWRAKTGPLGKADAIERAALLRGLDALAEAYGRGRHDPAAARATRLP
jgi:hypothetical protein